MNWVSHTVTDTGKVRRINEDSIYHSDDQKIWVVADGMGGHHRGDVASQTIIESLKQISSTKHSGVCLNRIVEALSSTNSLLIEKSTTENTEIIASTCAILSCFNSYSICSWVGDSRIYRFRNSELTRLTRDHSYKSLIDDLRIQGERVNEILVDPQTLTRGVGAEEELQIEHCHYSLSPDDRFLLCTDGLYKEVDELFIQQLYLTGQNDESILAKLHDTYLNSGARDNLGLILVSTDRGSETTIQNGAANA